MKRPASVTLFGILNILFGGLSLLSLLFDWMVTYSDGAGDDPVFAAMEASTFYSTWMKLTLILGVIASLVVIASGIGLLQMRRWARIAAVGYCVYSIFMLLAGGVMGWFFVFSPLLEEHRVVQESAPWGFMIGGLFGVLLGGFFGLIYPVALLYFMTRPGLVAAFDGTSGPEPALSTPAPSAPVAASAPLVLGGSNPYGAPPTPVQTKPEAPLDTGDEVLATVIPFRNKPALISYYLGLFSLSSLIPVLGLIGVGMAIAALILGIKGRRLAKTQPEVKGTAHAWVGILGGTLWGVLGILMQTLTIVALVVG